MTDQRSICRRDFLSQITAVSVAACPTVVPATALGRAGNVAANERVHIGVIGTGGRGAHLAHFMPPTGRVVAISDCVLQQMERAQARTPENEWAKY